MVTKARGTQVQVAETCPCGERHPVDAPSPVPPASDPIQRRSDTDVTVPLVEPHWRSLKVAYRILELFGVTRRMGRAATPSSASPSGGRNW